MPQIGIKGYFGFSGVKSMRKEYEEPKLPVRISGQTAKCLSVLTAPKMEWF